MVSPSTNDSTLTSRPVMNSSMTILFPAVPNALSSMICFTPALAASMSSQISTPFPSARPSAFRTIGKSTVSGYASAAAGSVKFSYFAVGIPYFFIRSFENAFEPSRIAAFFRGPNARMPASSKRSMSPPTSGSSMPTTARPISFSFANSTSRSNSIAAIGTHSANSAMPALPGAQ